MSLASPSCNDCQRAVYFWHRLVHPDPLVLCNIFLWKWESDAIYVTRAGYVYEYEVKVSMADFRADLRDKQWKHELLKNGNPDGPKLFSFVCPFGVIPLAAVPEYAGLYYVTLDQYGGPHLKVVKSPPVRKAVALPVEKWMMLAGKSTGRYWEKVFLIDRIREAESGPVNA